MPKPHILILDPAPERTLLIEHIQQLGYPLDVAKGLHDAMVQSIIRKPALIIADLTLADACGHACQQRLEQMPHLEPIPFLTIDTPADGDTQASNQTTLDRLKDLLPTPADGDTGANPPPPNPQPILADLLAQLATQGASATVAITGSGDDYGEILVRDGVAIHAVVDTGLTGPKAMAAIATMDKVDVSLGQAPHPDAPNTLTETPTETHKTLSTALPTPLPGDDPTPTDAPPPTEPLVPLAAPQAPQNAAPDPVADAPDRDEVLALLNELAAFGIVSKGQP